MLRERRRLISQVVDQTKVLGKQVAPLAVVNGPIDERPTPCSLAQHPAPQREARSARIEGTGRERLGRPSKIRCVLEVFAARFEFGELHGPKLAA